MDVNSHGKGSGVVLRCHSSVSRERGHDGHRLALAVLAVLLAGCTVGAGATRAQAIDPAFPVTNGNIAAMAVAGDTLYLGGHFSWIGEANGGMVALDATTGAPVARWPRIHSRMQDGLFLSSATTSLPDGEGGCWVGGNFESVSGVARAGLAHVRADGTLDAWNPGLDPYAHVDHMVRVGETLYLGGGFSSVGGQPRNGLAAVHARTGAVLPWNPQAVGPTGGSATVRAMASDGMQLFVAGSFSAVGGQPRARLAALDLVSGLATPWDPAPSSEVWCLAVGDGVVYVGGAFSSIGGQARRGVAALDPWVGAATAWDAGAGEWATVNCLAVSGSQLFVCGSFTQVGGAARAGLAALDVTSGQATPWQPQRAWGSAQAIATDGAVVYLGGWFVLAENEAPHMLLAVDSGLGTRIATWSAGADQPVTSIAVNGSRVFASGAFAGCGGQAAQNLAAIELRSGRPLPWRPRLDGNALCLDADGPTLYVGGVFTSIDEQSRGGLAAFARATGQLAAWDPSHGAPNSIGHLAAGGGKVYVESHWGASFGGQPATRLAALDASAGGGTLWNATYDGGGNYRHISGLIETGARVFLYGEFETVNGQPRRAVAALDAGTGATLPWNPNILSSPFNPGAVGYIEAAALHGASLFTSGRYGTIGGIERSGLVGIDTASALPTGWLPSFDALMTAMVASDSVVLAGWGGYAFGIEPTPSKNGLLAFDATDGAMNPWFPHVYGREQWGIASLAMHGSDVIAGGHPDLLGDDYCRSSLVRIRPTDNAAPTVEALSPAGGESFVIGSHQTIQWLASDDQAVAASDLYLSRSGASGPWELLAGGVTGVPAYDWTVSPPAAAGTCWLRVDVRDHAGNSTTAASLAPFSIAHTTGVPAPAVPAVVALHTPAPNPARGAGTIGFALPGPGHVRLVVLDLQGREVAVLVDGELPAGQHLARLPEGLLPPAVYFVRLRAGREVRTSRVVVLR